MLAIASQNHVSRILLPYKSLHSNRDMAYDEMVLIFVINTFAKPHVKRLTDGQFLRFEFLSDVLHYYNLFCVAGFYCSGNSTRPDPDGEEFGDRCPPGAYCSANSSQPLLCPRGKREIYLH